MKSKNIYERIGEKIKQRRTQLHIGQEEAAFRSDLSVGLFGSIERGQGNPTVETLKCIATGLCVDVSDLTNTLPIPSPGPGIPAYYQEYYDQLDGEEQRLFLSYVDTFITLRIHLKQ